MRATEVLTVNRSRVLAAFGLASLSMPALVPAEVPADPRPGSAVVDTTGTLGVADLALIDSLAVRARAQGELVVVVIQTVGGVPPRQFTTQLFNRWRLDPTPRNRGVVLLAALKDRKAEIVIGDGYTKSATQVTDRIMKDVIVPRFRAGQPRDALVEGARAIVDRLVLGQRLPGSTAGPPPSTAPRPLAAVPPRPVPPRPVAPPPPLSLMEQATETAAEHPVPVAGGVGGAVLTAVTVVRRYLRRRPRTCSGCSSPMVRLDEAADDAHLTSGEKAEERVKSVDYDVWACESCRHTLKLRYGTIFTSYGRCPGCNAKTLSAETTTLVPATTSSSGTARVDESCEHCSYKNSYNRTIPQKSSSSSRSSGSSGSSGGSSSGRGSSGSW
jgi:uncharacterized protein